MENKIFAYARVSTKYQSEMRQVDDFLKLGVEERNIFVDKASSRTMERPNYQTLKQCLRKGDLLYLHSLDRLARDRKLIRDTWRELTEMGVDIIVSTQPLLNTTLYKDTLGSFVNDLILEIFGYCAESEFENNHIRQREGIDTAKKYGTKTGNPFGRPRVKVPENFEEVTARWKKNEITAVSAMKELNLSKPTFYKMVKQKNIVKENLCENLK